MNKKLLISLTVPLIAGILAVCFIRYEQPGTSYEVNITGSIIEFTRSQEMILVSKGRNSHVDMFKALGWSHAHDRYVQICLFRLAARGELTKHLPFAESARKQDIKSNQMNLRESSKKSLPHMETRHVNQMQAYVDGINEYLRSHIRPLEFMLINFNPEPFDVVDVLAIYKFISYAGLNDICLIIEKLIIEVTQETDQINLLKDTFYPHLEIVDDELIEIYRSIKDIRSIAVQETAHVSKLTNSNNWVVSGNRSESGKPIMGSDPHMDISKTPNIFYENHYVGDDGHTFFGISTPGFSGYIMGRSRHIAMSFTYGMLDMSDYFIENVNSRKEYERDGEFFAFKERMVIIAGKTYYFYDTLEGHTLERSLEGSEQPISAGKYLATKFSLTIQADTYIPNLFNIPLDAKTVYDVQDSLKLNSLGTNLLASDSLGNIAYQQVCFCFIYMETNYIY